MRSTKRMKNYHYCQIKQLHLHLLCQVMTLYFAYGVSTLYGIQASSRYFVLLLGGHRVNAFGA